MFWLQPSNVINSMLHFHFYSLQCFGFVLFFPWDFLWSTDCCLVANCWKCSCHHCYWLVWFHCSQKNTLYDFNYLKFVEVCSIAQDMVYLSVCYISTWNRYSLAVEWSCYKCHLYLTGRWIEFIYTLACFLFSCAIYC